MKLLVFSCCLSVILALGYSTELEENSLPDLIGATGTVKFFLYTVDNPSTAQELISGNVESVINSYFNASKETKVLIHGWDNSYLTIPNPMLRDAYLSQGDYNIISVDWSDYAKLDYASARLKVSVVGKDLAKFVDFLNEKFEMSFDSIVVIGHSLGAHIAGYCGKLVTRGKLAAIVGLDAASPTFFSIDPSTRLASTDANYVLTLHTNGGLKGFKEPIGKASFYANWGSVQPGCEWDLDGACAHARCVYLYAEAIRGYSFAPVYKCENFALNILLMTGCKEDPAAQLGDPLHIPQVKGIYNFFTNSEEPFGDDTN